MDRAKVMKQLANSYKFHTEQLYLHNHGHIVLSKNDYNQSNYVIDRIDAVVAEFETAEKEILERDIKKNYLGKKDKMETMCISRSTYYRMRDDVYDRFYYYVQ